MAGLLHDVLCGGNIANYYWSLNFSAPEIYCRKPARRSIPVNVRAALLATTLAIQFFSQLSCSAQDSQTNDGGSLGTVVVRGDSLRLGTTNNNLPKYRLYLAFNARFGGLPRFDGPFVITSEGFPQLAYTSIEYNEWSERFSSRDFGETLLGALWSNSEALDLIKMFGGSYPCTDSVTERLFGRSKVLWIVDGQEIEENQPSKGFVLATRKPSRVESMPIGNQSLWNTAGAGTLAIWNPPITGVIGECSVDITNPDNGHTVRIPQEFILSTGALQVRAGNQKTLAVDFDEEIPGPDGVFRVSGAVGTEGLNIIRIDAMKGVTSKDDYKHSDAADLEYRFALGNETEGTLSIRSYNDQNNMQMAGVVSNSSGESLRLQISSGRTNDKLITFDSQLRISNGSDTFTLSNTEFGGASPLDHYEFKDGVDLAERLAISFDENVGYRTIIGLNGSFEYRPVTSSALVPGASEEREEQDVTTWTQALFVEQHIRLVSSLDFFLSSKFEDVGHRVVAASNSVDILSPMHDPAVNAEVTKFLTSFSGGVEHQLDKKTRIRASAQLGYVQPTADELDATRSFGNVLFLPNPRLAPERHLLSELEIDHQFRWEGVVGARLYALYVSNAQDSVPLMDPSQTMGAYSGIPHISILKMQNIPRRQGFGATVSYKQNINEDMSVELVVGEENENSIVPSPLGPRSTKAPRVPAWRTRLSVSENLTKGSGVTLSFEGLGPYFMDEANLTKCNASLLADCRYWINIGDDTVFVGVKNLADNKAGKFTLSDGEQYALNPRRFLIGFLHKW